MGRVKYTGVFIRKYKLLQDVIIKETGQQTYIVSTMQNEPQAVYLVAGIGKPIKEQDLKPINNKNETTN